MKKAVALLSGGLDSSLAVRIMQNQGFYVEGLNVITPFTNTVKQAQHAAEDLKCELRCVPVDDSYIEIIRNPKFGYGKGANPCLDCHLFMCRMAQRRMEETGSDLVITGEILGQRPMSQRRHHLEMIEHHSGLKGRILRPISAKLLPPTIPELEKLVDREKLYGFQGRMRGPLHALAKELGITYIPQAMPGCCLTEHTFAPRVYDLIRNTPAACRWEYDLLTAGRHARIDENVRIIIARNERDCDKIRALFMAHYQERSDMAYFEPETYMGPSVLLIGRVNTETLRLAAAFQVHYSHKYEPNNIIHRVYRSALSELVPFTGTVDISKYRVF